MLWTKKNKQGLDNNGPIQNGERKRVCRNNFKRQLSKKRKSVELFEKDKLKNKKKTRREGNSRRFLSCGNIR